MVRKRSRQDSTEDSHGSFTNGSYEPGASSLNPTVPNNPPSQGTSHTGFSQAREYWSSSPDNATGEGEEVYSPNLIQDTINAQGMSPAPEFDHSDHILDRTTQQQFDDRAERERAAQTMENWHLPWNDPQFRELGGLSGGAYQYYTSGIFGLGISPVVDASPPWPGPQQSSSAASPEVMDQGHHYADPNRQRPRGGRRRGTNLPANTVVNARAVRQIGACLRCRVLRERCSQDNPCQTCASTTGRKWCGCYRSLLELVDAMSPLILDARLSRAEFERFMREHTTYIAIPVPFALPLNLGFGRSFYGFDGVEFEPLSEESRFTYTVRPRGEDQASPQSDYAIPVYPSYTNQQDIQRLLIDWLKATLRESDSMEQWRRVCFPAADEKWMRDLLRNILHYSYACWKDKDPRYHKIGETLVYAWMMTLLVTMLSLQITVAEEGMPFIHGNLQASSVPGGANASRPINKAVKGLLVEIYKQMVRKVMSALDEMIRSKEPIGEREWGHYFCMSILIVVVVSRVQMSVMDNYRLAEPFQRENWAATVEALEQLEAVYKNLTLVFHWKHKKPRARRPRRNSSRDRRGVLLDDNERIADPQLQALVHSIQQIRQNHRDDVYRLRGENLRTHMDQKQRFNAFNTQRLFAFYFDLMYPARLQ